MFLDEIGELPMELQAKLRRVLDNREVLPVGAGRSVSVDVLIIAATNRPLEQMVEAGTFRRDLFARLAGARIALPPLRDRAEDLFAIANGILAARGEAFDASHVEVEAVERMMLHPWQSNVREVASALDRIALIDRPPLLRFETVERVLGRLPESARPSLTSEQVARAMAESGGNESAAARRLGVTRGKLRRFPRAEGAMSCPSPSAAACGESRLVA